MTVNREGWKQMQPRYPLYQLCNPKPFLGTLEGTLEGSLIGTLTGILKGTLL